MGLYNIKATAFETPAPGVFGAGTVTNPTVNGHDSSTIGTSAGNPDVGMSCEFRTFPAVPPLLRRLLKASWSIDGILFGAGAISQFSIDHSLNGGSSWSSTVVRNNVNAPDSGTISITLSAGQDITQVRLRDLFQCAVNDTNTESAQGFMTISNIRIELLAGDGPSVMQ